MIICPFMKGCHKTVVEKKNIYIYLHILFFFILTRFSRFCQVFVHLKLFFHQHLLYFLERVFRLHRKALKPLQTPAGSVQERPEHLDNVSMRKCSQRRRRKGHLDRGELENDRNVRRHFY